MNSEDRAGSPACERLTLRSLLLGTALAALISVGDPYSLYQLHSTMWAISYLPFCVVVFFFAIVLANALLARWREAWAFTRTELLVVFIMALVAASIPTWGTTSYLLSVIAAPHHYASPENRWGELILPFLPAWLTPRSGETLRWFFEGLPAGKTIPWSDWAGPLFWWTSLIVVVFLLCQCLVAAFRKQWVERERLSYPLMQIAYDLTEPDGRGGRLPAFLKNRVFWFGFAPPFLIVMWNILGYFFPNFEPIRTNFGWVSLGRYFPGIVLNLNFPVVGFAFLIHRNVAFSIWFFVLLSMLEEGAFNRFGYIISGRDVYTLGHPAIGWQSFGAMTAMVIGLFWAARSHLGNIVRNAFRRHRDDADEIMSHRAIVFGTVFSLAYILAWLRCSGFTWTLALFFLFGMLVVYIGLTRIVVESGLLFIRGPLIPQTFASFALGPVSLPPQAMASLGLSYSWMHELKGFFMPAACHAAKLADSMRTRRRAVTVCVFWAALVATAVSIWYTIHIGYTHGAQNFGGWIFGRGSQVPYEEVARKMVAAQSADWERLSFMGIGAAAMTLLMACHYRFPWWPVHPMGLPVAVCSYPMTIYVFSIFLAWLAKTIVLWMGGSSLYERVRPFFIGMILGFFVGAGVSFGVDMLWFPEEGHVLYGD